MKVRIQIQETVQDGVIGRMSVAPEKGIGASRILRSQVAAVGQRTEDVSPEEAWVHKKNPCGSQRLSTLIRKSTTITKPAISITPG